MYLDISPFVDLSLQAVQSVLDVQVLQLVGHATHFLASK